MNYSQWYLQNGKFQKHEAWIVQNLMLESIMGSHAYGCNTIDSDYDILGIVMPKPEHLMPQSYGFILGFDALPNFQRKEMKGKEKRVVIGKQEVEAEWVSLIEFFNQAGLKGSPNLIEILFVRKNFVTVGTKMGYYLRDNRRKFLSMKTYFSMRGYCNGQMHRIRQRNPETLERKALVEKHGYDCYVEQTEFLTEKGWKKYDDISSEKLATVQVQTGKLEFQSSISRIKKYGEFDIYQMQNNFTKFAVTENHNILNSVCHRSDSLTYNESKSDWKLTPIKLLDNNNRSWYHIRTSFNNQNKSYNKDLDELTFIGLYLAEGSLCFRKNKKQKIKQLKALRISQTKNGKQEVFDFLRKVKDKFNLKEYSYKHITSFGAVEETVWITHQKPFINKIYKEFGKTKTKKYPRWILKLSSIEADALRYGMLLGDGTIKKQYNQEIYYSTNKLLNDLYQLLAMLSNRDATVMGPYVSKGITTYQTLVNNNISKPKALCISTKNITNKGNDTRGGKIIKYSGNVVCFEVPNNTLITRLDGKIAIQGNCKMGYHVMRLIDQLNQVLTTNDIDLMRNKEECKRIRAGEFGNLEYFESEFQRRMSNLDDLVTKCNLSQMPNVGELKILLQEILEEHFGSLTNFSNSSKQTSEFISCSDVMAELKDIKESISNSKQP